MTSASGFAAGDCGRPTHRAVREINVVCLARAAPKIRPSAAAERGPGTAEALEIHDYLPDRGPGLALLSVATVPDRARQLAAESEEPAPSAPEEAPDHSYQVGPGDQLQILVWQHPDLSTGVVVRPDGRISVPLVEDLYVAGKTPTRVADDIAEQLSRLIQDPLVTVMVSGFSGTFAQQVRVVGQAVTPSAIPYRDAMTILDVLVAVGGLSPFADGNGALIIRREGEERRQIPLRLDDLLDDGDSSANVAVAPGDVVIIPEGFFDGDWRIRKFVTFNQEISDNIDREPEGEEHAALVTEVGLVSGINVNTARITGALTTRTVARQQFLFDSGTEIQGNANGTTTIEFLENQLFLDASLASNRQTINTRDTGANRDQSQVTTARISPYLRNRFGSFATSELRLNLAQTMVDSDEDTDSGGISDDTTASASFFLGSGRDFSRFIWSATVFASETERSEGETISEQEARFNAEYALWRELSLLGAIGYQIRDEEDGADSIDEPTWEFGFHLRPGPRTDLRVTYGQRDGDTSARVNFSYRLGPASTITASYTEELQTAQERLLSDLEQISIDPDTGELIDRRTQRPFDPDTSPFGIEDETRRSRRLNVTFAHAKHRDSYFLSLQAEEQGPETGETDETVMSASATWSRRLNPRTTAAVTAFASRNEFTDGDITDHELQLDASLGYQLTQDVSSNLSYTHSRRLSTEAEDEFIENLFQIGVNIRF